MAIIPQPAAFSNAPTDDQIDFQRKMAARLMQQGTSIEPVGHWTQALGRALQGLSGGMWNQQAVQGDRDAEASVQAALSGKMSPQQLMLNPRTRQYGMQMYTQDRAAGMAEARERRAEERAARDPLRQVQIQTAQAQLQQLRDQQQFDREFLGGTAPQSANPALGAAATAGREAEMPQPQMSPMQMRGAELRSAVAALPPERRAAFMALWQQGDRKSAISMLTKDPADFGKTGSIFKGDDGRFYTIQFGSDGSRRIMPVEADGKSLAPAKGTTVVGDEVLDSATGQTVRNVAPQIAGGEAAKVEGRAQGEGKSNLGKAETALKTYRIQSNMVMEDIDRALQNVSWGTTGWRGAAQSYVKGSPAYDLNELLASVKANVGFDKLQDMRANSPTGGALGSVTERELALLTATLGSIESAQSESQLRFNLQRLSKLMKDFQVLREEAFQRDLKQYGGGGASRKEFPNLPAGVTIQKVD